MAQANPFHSPWQGSLWDLTRIVITIRRARAFGRLTLRNSDRVGIVHLYFHSGNLVHIVGSSGNAEATLHDLMSWTHAVIRFERGTTPTTMTLSKAEVQSFDELLLSQRPFLRRLGYRRLVCSGQYLPRQGKNHRGQ